MKPRVTQPVVPLLKRSSTLKLASLGQLATQRNSQRKATLHVKHPHMLKYNQLGTVQLSSARSMHALNPAGIPASMRKNLMRLPLRPDMKLPALPRLGVTKEVSLQRSSTVTDEIPTQAVSRVVIPGDWGFEKKLYETGTPSKDYSKLSEFLPSEIEEELSSIHSECSSAHGSRQPIQTTMLRTSGAVPESCWGSSFSLVTKNLVLYGGKKHSGFSGLFVYKPKANVWQKVHSVNPPMGRAGHSASVYQTRLVVYGGTENGGISAHKKALSSTIYTLDCSSMTWFESEASGASPPPRYFHAAATLGKSLIVYGGLGDDDRLLHDVHVLALDTFEWQTPQFTYSRKPLNRSHATLTAVFPESLASDPQTDVFQSHRLGNGGKHEGGFYLFGGLGERGEALNDLWILRFSTHGCWWARVGEAGAPEPRYAHTTTLHGDALLVVGGTNDQLSYPLTEVHLFSTTKGRWSHPRLSNPNLSRSGHCAVTYQGKILIFGGQSSTSPSTNTLLSLHCK